ncbi:MAG: hypothetical protein P1P84_15805 [Deferrisomatales bacterium]|nr:hypothetical protein [Deferrisomatales bacterium]
MKILAVYYSRTGTTEAVARSAADLLAEMGHALTRVALQPRVDLPYPLWLALSFVPGSRFPVAAPPDPSGFDACLLALPKWTFACPPVNTFLAQHGSRLPPTAVLVTCGGWDQDRYLAQLERRLQGQGVSVLGGLALRKKELQGDPLPQILSDLLGTCFPVSGS